MLEQRCNSPHLAWAKLDSKKVGEIDLQGFRDGLEALQIYLSFDELSKCFAFMDQNHDGKIDNFELINFFMPTLPAMEEQRNSKINYENL